MAAALIAIVICALPLRGDGEMRGIHAVTKTGASVQLYNEYHALVIGVSEYEKWPDLPNTVKDAQEVSEALKGIGFKTTLLENPDSEQLNRALTGFAYSTGGIENRALLLYFAGHGETVEMADGTKLGYIVPSDCPLQKDDPLEFDTKAISMQRIETLCKLVRSRHVLALFDSCFSGSLFSLTRAAPTDISEKTSMPVRQFVTAGAADEPVPDQSIFKICFIDALKGDADLNQDFFVTGSELGMYLNSQVVNYSRGSQHPQYGKINNPKLDKGDFVIALPKPPEPKPEPAPEPKPEPTPEPKPEPVPEPKPVTEPVPEPKPATGPASEPAAEPKPPVQPVETPDVEPEKPPLVTKIIKKSGKLMLDIYPPGSDVCLDGQSIGQSDSNAKFQMEGLDAGVHALRVTKEGHVPFEYDLELQPGGDIKFAIKLEPEKPPIPAWASVLDQGQLREAQNVGQPPAYENSAGIRMAFIPKGEYVMGTADVDGFMARFGNKRSAYSYELPAHKVDIKKPFYMSMHEVTRAQYARVTGGTVIEGEEGQLPVGNISWNRATEFCAALSTIENREYRLPTEEEWEYACRAGSNTAFFFGNDEKELDNYAWYRSNAGGMIHPVGGKTPNGWGLYDMLGNVWEWCNDPFRETYSSKEPVKEMGVLHRTIRGGAMDGMHGSVRSAFRRGLTSGGAYGNIGFRVLTPVE
ncbi:MAG TPA: SUMF1/EgtB/PvdO family nonheme iron enzyme [Candidatus Brocadiia bacterium]|nr:SUMF1/EgtB/PvdO family nonheme iron enzyme [Candidatus Brocadiia bacterium]